MEPGNQRRWNLVVVVPFLKILFGTFCKVSLQSIDSSFLFSFIELGLLFEDCIDGFHNFNVDAAAVTEIFKILAADKRMVGVLRVGDFAGDAGTFGGICRVLYNSVENEIKEIFSDEGIGWGFQE